jgi:hypothetical protein
LFVRSHKHRETEYRAIAVLVLAACLCLMAPVMYKRHGLATSRIVSDDPSKQNQTLPNATVSAVTEHAVSAGVQPETTSEPDELSPELRTLAERDPLAAAAWIANLPERLRVELAAAIASAWGKREPELAAAWARDQLDGEAREQALLSVSADWTLANPVAAAEYGLTISTQMRQEEFLKTVGTQWGRQDSVAALAWADRSLRGMARESFLSGLCSTLAETSPLQAAQLVASLGNSQLAVDSALTVVLELGRQQPETAAEWVKLFPAGLRERGLLELVSLWAQQSSDSAPPALLSWPQGLELDQAIRKYLDEILEVRPANGVEVLFVISNEELRREETERLAQHWLMRDASAARHWLAQRAVTRDPAQSLSNPNETSP